MDWYKTYHGLPADARLAVVARRAGATRASVLAVWLMLLDTASRARPRGNVSRADAEEIAALLDIDAVQAGDIVTAFYDRGLIDGDGTIAEWYERQVMSTARVKAFRARQKEHDLAAASDGINDGLGRNINDGLGRGNINNGIGDDA